MTATIRRDLTVYLQNGQFDATAFGSGNDTVERALDLLGQALSILDDENLLTAAAKVDEARASLREFTAFSAA